MGKPFRLLRPAPSLLLFALAVAAAGIDSRASGQPPPQPEKLFQTAKNHFKLGAYRQSLETLNALEAASREPGYEQQQSKLALAIAFYRGANLAALGEKKAAQVEFAIYLAAFPQADLDRGGFPKPVLEAFEAARAQLPGFSAAGKQSSARNTGIAAAYASFQPKPVDSSSADDQWISGPVRYLLTKSERAAWDRMTDPAERAEFITRMWQQRNPDPLTSENEFKIEFEKRIQFADTHFTVGETRGSQTDRGLVFALLGPPTYIVDSALRSKDDPLQVARAAPVRQTVPLSPPNPRSTTTTIYVEQTPLTAQEIQGTREIWHYGRGQLPRSVAFSEMDFEFLTKAGYGTGVLQRDQLVLLALEAAAQGGKGRK